MSIMPNIIHWFRRDLRLADNPAFTAASQVSQGAVVPLFILDDNVLQSSRTSAARVVFMLESLRALDASLRAHGSRLIIRHGSPEQCIAQVIDETDAVGVYWNRDYSPFARQRDTIIEKMLRGRGVDVHTHKDAVIWEIDEILTKNNTPYTVYTPYARQWRARVEANPVLLAEAVLPGLQPVPDTLSSSAIPLAAELGFATQQLLPSGGEQVGLEQLNTFVHAQNAPGIHGYAEQRNFPAKPGTSRLSPYLRFGCIAPQTCLRAAHKAGFQQHGSETWVGELAWRDFYYQILYHFPHVLQRSFKSDYDKIEWDNNEVFFAAWCEGRTGYPIVDAAMRQLTAEAWMHNRARMIVASFLTKDLLIDWRWGERYFMQQLVDGDHASNNGGWQWAAGTGTDAQPYFRIFNPISQSEKFDLQGDYIRHYVPELQHVSASYIHTPWNMSQELQRQVGIHIGRDYPMPIVDHAMQRQRALELYKRARAE
ncbi:MAG: deoxyribodipyrimidine photo-lyase [Chloroflexi bacterium AL-W]|nr:deoxyribodipyrimidine photo-lyase [Chloroflexi bacterium AL-N1]NOK69998.1 deoxyribodipyrimidine photo-lyase [Chloroflexi bacterium AL-N10]NOK73704.1 deoxyribodipyrimidine photo-lyase [Chloroflexi bacterium AL-N5]NOK85530.1 deoxyribodipyrimidine photo-lyase [Chloroflexi bacterium AL-W]NOK91731.1 deoxyribodipyrimidine photo-lyase [Chloroflexi bacterium AL-N15]